MPQDSFLLYGANGYTGNLISRFSKDFNLQPVLAGRTKEKIESLSKNTGLPCCIADLEDETILQNALRNVKLVVNTAGPFKFTAFPMLNACLKTGTHYIDINGDITVFERLKLYDAAAKKAGIMILPGVGFDVVPTDCLSLFLKKRLPDANRLQLAFAMLGGRISHGTAITMSGKLGESGASRKNGMIVCEPLGRKCMEVDFGIRKMFVMSIPWGDISTAYHTTAIPDIETYTHIKPWIYRLLKWQLLFNPILRHPLVRNYVTKRIDRRPAGPTDEIRSKALSLVWGRAYNAAGKTISARLQCPEGYTLTALSTLLIAKKILSGDAAPGFQTPAGMYGEDLILEVPGVVREADTG